MAHADYRMKGTCKICQEIQFVGVCPHGMAERIDRATITPEEIEEALKKAIPGAKELEKKLEVMFEPPRPRGERTPEEFRDWLSKLAEAKKAEWHAYAEKKKHDVVEILEDASTAVMNMQFDKAAKLIWEAEKALKAITYDWWMEEKPSGKAATGK